MTPAERLAAARAELEAATEAARAEAQQMHAEGQSDYAIAAALGVDRGTVRRWVR